MKVGNISNKLSSLEALLDAETDDIDVALKSIEDHVDPESLRRRISLLLTSDRVDDAYSISNTYELHSEWVELGIRAAVFANEFSSAENYTIQSNTLDDSTGTLHFRCVVSFADAILTSHFTSRLNSEQLVSMYAVEPAIQPILEKSVEFLLPYGDAVLGRHSISSPLESEAITLLLLSLALLGRNDRAKLFLPLLVRYGKVNAHLGQFMVEGRLPMVDGFSEVLVKSNPDDFYAVVISGLLRYESGSSLQSVFTELSSLAIDADDKDQQATLFSALSSIIMEGDESFEKELDKLKVTFLDLDNPVHNVKLAIHEILRNNWKEAEFLLDKYPLPNDPQWMKAKAHCNYVSRKIDDGVSGYINAALLFKDYIWLSEAADRAYQNKNFDGAIQCLNCIRDYYPWNNNARVNLVNVLVNEGHFDKAITEVAYLVEGNPEDSQLALTLAQLYLQVNKAEKAKEILADLNELSSPPLEAVLLYASALVDLENPKEGFEALEKYKNNFWDKKEFLFSYLEKGYASGREAEANEALQVLNELRVKGEIDPKLFRLGSLDELVGIAKESNDRLKKLQDGIIQGKMPWTLCAEEIRRPILFDWKIRTQKLKWSVEDSGNRAEFSVYMTNYFGANIQDDKMSIAEIEAVLSGNNVCVDYSALITLHALGRLPLLFSMYEKISIPEQYRLRVQEDRRRLQPHQISHQDGYEEIRRLVNQGVIKKSTNVEDEELPIIDEYYDGKNSYSKKRLITVIGCLVKGGKIQKSKENKILEIINQEEAGGSPLALKDRIIVNLGTLMTIFREELLEILSDNFRVYITESDFDEVTRDLGGFEFQRDALKENDDLWGEINKQPNVEYVSSSMDEEDNKNRGNISLLSLKIAESRGLPLVVDDRVLQAILINSRGVAKGAAFGTDAILKNSFLNKQIDISDYSNSILQLIKWRYKFIVPGAEIMHYFTNLYDGIKLGNEIILITQYMHDCMRDPGLFGGLEESEPPVSMALKLYMAWVHVIGEYLALVWTDESIEDSRSASLTETIAQIMLPSVPMAIQEQFQSRVAYRMDELLVVSALLRAIEFKSHKRFPENLRKLSQFLGISDYRHEQLISEVIIHAAK